VAAKSRPQADPMCAVAGSRTLARRLGERQRRGSDRSRVPALVAALLRREQLSADRLTIEITETSIIEQFDRAKAAVERLAELGVKLAVDDFGAGFTSPTSASSPSLS
jgi:EAL domain-containing protein (putative c-di-GMP-specific phosphodiesterase class I)